MMQDIHGGILGGAASSTGAGQMFADRRLRPHSHHHLHHHQALKCPRCDSLNTKFCYYNNYNLSQPRHFCKNCRRYWTKGGVLRNVPVGGGCRKSSKRSSFSPSSASKSKASPPSPPARGAEGGVTAAAEQNKPNSRSSSESTSHVKSNGNNKLAAAATAQSGLNVNFMNSSNIQSSDPIMMSTATATTTSDAGSACSPSPLFKFSDHTSAVDGTRWSFDSLIAVDQGPAPSAMDQCGSGGGGIFAEIGSLMNLMNASDSNTGSGGVVNDQQQQQQQQNHHHHHQQLLLELFGGTGSSGAANHHLAPFRLQYHQDAADHQNNWPPLSEKNIDGGILDQTSTGHVNVFQERPTSGAVLDSFFDLTGNSTVLDVSGGGGGGVMVDSSRHHHDDHIHTSYWGSTQTTTSSQWPQHDDENNQYNQLYLPP